MEEYMIPCMSKSLFGIECPGCGAQRAFALMIKGEFADAFFMFPAIYTTLIFLLFVSLSFIDRARNYHKLIISSAIINAVIMIVAFIYKISNH